MQSILLKKPSEPPSIARYTPTQPLPSGPGRPADAKWNHSPPGRPHSSDCPIPRFASSLGLPAPSYALPDYQACPIPRLRRTMATWQSSSCCWRQGPASTLPDATGPPLFMQSQPVPTPGPITKHLRLKHAAALDFGAMCVGVWLHVTALHFGLMN